MTTPTENPIKLLIVSQYYWPEVLPINYVVSFLIKNGYEVDILTARPNYPSGEFFEGYGYFTKIFEELNYVKIYRMPIIPRGKRQTSIGLSLNYLSFIISTSLIGPFILRKNNYDLIFVYGLSPITKALPAILIGKIKKIPVMLWVQDLWPDSINSTSHRLPSILFQIIRNMVKFIYEKVDYILVTSSGFLKKISDDFGIPNEKMSHLPNTIDKIFYENSPESKDLSEIVQPFKGKFNILFTGNIGSAQSIDTVIEAASILKSRNNQVINFILVGSGSMLKQHKIEVESKSLSNIHFLGQYPLEDMPAFIDFSDSLLVTLNDKEVFNLTIPNKIQSYLASRKPILGSLNGSGADLIDQIGCGLASPAEDALLLANNAEKMSAMETYRLQEMSENGYSFFRENYSDDVFIRKLRKYLNLVIDDYMNKKQ